MIESGKCYGKREKWSMDEGLQKGQDSSFHYGS